MKISIIGAGQVGSITALFCLMRGLAKEIVLMDIIPNLPQGKALDLNQSAIVFGMTGRVHGTNDYEDISSSDIVVVTAGFPRKEGMTRLDLLQRNAKIVLDAAENIKKYSPESIVILVTNPLDVMSWLFYKKSGFSKNRVIGMAGVLDTARFNYYLERDANIPSAEISPIVLGVHGENMVPMVEGVKVCNVDGIVASTRQGGAEIVKCLKTSASIAPAASVAKMVEAIVNDKRDVYPASVYLDGEYGYRDIFLGVPVRLGRHGVEKIVELRLSEEIKQELDRAAGEVKVGIEGLGGL